MEMLVSRDWLRRKIEADPDIENDVGNPIEALEDIGMFLPAELSSEDEEIVELKHVFGVLIRQLRRSEQLTIEELARKARIEIEELKLVEHDPHYRPRPRVVHQLAEYFDVPSRSLMKLSGATISRDRALQEHAMKFAAKSDDLSKLTQEEQILLNEFVKYLALEVH